MWFWYDNTSQLLVCIYGNVFFLVAAVAKFLLLKRKLEPKIESAFLWFILCAFKKETDLK